MALTQPIFLIVTVQKCKNNSLLIQIIFHPEIQVVKSNKKSCKNTFFDFEYFSLF